MKTRRFASAVVLVGAVALGACEDAPLAPETALEPSYARSATAPPPRGQSSITEIALAGGFTQLVGALQYVDEAEGMALVDLFLNGTDQYTVFAPTDAAFQGLYGLLGTVLGAPVDEIRDLPSGVVLDVLLYHVTEGRRAANSVLPKRGERAIVSLLGESFSVRGDGSLADGLTGIRSDAKIVSADISASNGIIHVIDQVIVPPSVVAALTS